MSILRSKDIKNYISNSLGISKDEIKDEIFNTIKEMVSIEVEKCLNDENRLQSLVEKEVLRQIKKSDGRNSYIVMTMDAIYNKIDKVIHEEVLKRLVIELRSDEDVKSNKEDIM